MSAELIIAEVSERDALHTNTGADFRPGVRQQGAVPAASCTTLTIPAPPSVNELFANGKPGKTGRFKTPKYKAWLSEAGWMIREQMLSEGNAPIMGRIVVILGVERLSLAADIDNRAKAVLDLLVAQKVIEDDRYVTGIVLAWMPQGTRRTPLARIMIRPAEPLTLNFHPAPDGATGGWFIDAPEGEDSGDYA